MKLRIIGYWYSGREVPDWPDPRNWIDSNWPEEDRDLVVAHLEDGAVAEAYCGFARCRICDELAGSISRTDGTYLWPDGLVHYLLEHDVRLPDEFVEHVRKYTDELEGMLVDATWWKAAKPPPPCPTIERTRTVEIVISVGSKEEVRRTLADWNERNPGPASRAIVSSYISHPCKRCVEERVVLTEADAALVK